LENKISRRGRRASADRSNDAVRAQDAEPEGVAIAPNVELEDEAPIAPLAIDDLTDDEVLNATPNVLANDSELAARWLNIANARHDEAMREYNALRASMATLSQRIVLVDQIVQRQRGRHARSADTEAMREFLDQQQADRATRNAAVSAAHALGLNPIDGAFKKKG